MVKDFRHISLIRSLYKVIAKVLANLIVTVLDNIVDEIQSAFAYDSVRWDFIDDILRRFGFGEKWCLRINMNKNNLMGIFVDSNKVKHAAAKIGPMKVLQNMKSIRARFFNGADVNSKKQSWVRWKSVLAVRVVKALHGEDEKIGKKVQPRYPSTWLNIINEIESLKLHGIDLVCFITLKLGNEANTSFWDVAWCGDIAFKNLVPRLYALESMKNIEIVSKLSHGGLEFSFRRNPRGGVEQSQFERLKEMVECVTLSNSNDRWSWSLVGSGDFSVSSVRKLIDNAILPKGISKTRWIKEVPIKINVHV
nr:hypothetical protein [Tanacetum cinerariifolium]